jgi:hypothetical protein
MACVVWELHQRAAETTMKTLAPLLDARLQLHDYLIEAAL